VRSSAASRSLSCDFSDAKEKIFGLAGFRMFYTDSYPIIMRLSHEQFRELASKHGLAVTHQRQVVYEAVIASHGHHSPEAIYGAVRRRIPSISLATVYNNLRLFIDCGLLREVTPHASTLRVDGNREPHHHLVCSRCKSVQDIEGEFIDFNRLSRQLPAGFDLSQPLIEVFGLCRRCRAKSK
jgi:Fur family transcriptional regulator, peroxide stress response regulator